jgi:hypothetical protein
MLALQALSCFAESVSVVFYDNRFGTLNDVTGAYSPIGTLPVGASAGIASMNGLLYLEDFSNNLYSVDAQTGAAHLAGNSGLNLSLAVFGGGPTGLFELDYASNLYHVNASTGHASLIGSTGLAANNGYYDTSLSSNGTSLFYTAGRPGANDELYSISTVTGHATDLGSTGVTGIAGSAFVNGNLELYQYGQERNYIYSAVAGSTSFVRGARLTTGIIDGGAVLVSNAGGSSIAVTVVPEPGSVWLLALTLPLSMALRRTR